MTSGKPAFTMSAPLIKIFEEGGLTLPDFAAVAGNTMPEPYRSLLVHQDDMTPTLASYHNQTIRLRVLSREIHENALLRRVVLYGDKDERPVEFGAIQITLDVLSARYATGPPRSRTPHRLDLVRRVRRARRTRCLSRARPRR